MTSTALQNPAIRSRRSPREVVAAHPVAAMLLMMFTVAYTLLIPPALLGLALEPFLLGVVLLGQLLPAVLVTAAVGGRPAVRELFSRIFRWRVGAGNLALAVVALPLASLALVTAVFGTGAVHALVTDPGVILGYLGAVSILPLINLWEETAIMGVIQTRLADRHGMLLGAVLTAPAFAMIHLPLHLGPNAHQTPFQVVYSMAALLGLAVALRIVAGWLHERTNRSILMVAALHATFNATNNGDLLSSAAPDHANLISLAPWVVVLGWALLIVAGTRRAGRR